MAALLQCKFINKPHRQRFSMRFIFYIIYSIYTSGLYSQPLHSFLTLDTVFTIPLAEVGVSNHQSLLLQSDKNNEKLWISCKDCFSDSGVNMFTINPANVSAELIELPFEKGTSIIKNSLIETFTINHTNDVHLVLYNHYFKWGVADTNKSYSSMEHISDILWTNVKHIKTMSASKLWFGWSNNALGCLEKSSIGIWNLNNHVVEKQDALFMNEIEITHNGPNQYVDFSGNGALFCASPFKYNINTFDSLVNPLDTLQNIHTNWREPVSSVYVQLKNYSQVQEIFPLLRELVLKYSIIWETKYINDSLFYVKYSEPDTIESRFDFRFDFWKLSNSGWHPAASSIDDPIVNDDVPFEKTHFPPMLSFMYTKYLFAGTRLYVIRKEAEINPVGISSQEYYKLSNKWLKKNDPVYRLYIYNLHF